MIKIESGGEVMEQSEFILSERLDFLVDTAVTIKKNIGLPDSKRSGHPLYNIPEHFVREQYDLS